jgi:DNA-binding MarR family transcriptional regulator
MQMLKRRAEEPAALRLSGWLPYRLFVVATQVARPLEAFYGERFSLSQGAWRVLAVVAERTGVSASEISRACALDPFAVSRGISQLVERGVVRRNTAKADRRYASVSITIKGRVAFNEIAALACVIERDLLASLPAGARRSLDEALSSLEDASARIEVAGWRSLLERVAP